MSLDRRTVSGFGKQWQRFDQSSRSPAEIEKVFDRYFAIFPWQELHGRSRGLDIGCGTGRWARLVAERAASLVAVDASLPAVLVARDSLAARPNCRLCVAAAGQLPFADDAFDFSYCLGVLHHLPEPKEGFREACRVTRERAPVLVYVYYALDNRPAWYRHLWRLSDLLRRAVAVLPWGLRLAVSQTLAALVYWPLARSGRLLEKLGADVGSWPLSSYRSKSFYAMRTDALDRFGTRIEHRFTATDLRAILREAGLDDVRLGDSAPFWCAVGRKVGRSSRSE